jgi:hypothetical protein
VVTTPMARSALVFPVLLALGACHHAAAPTTTTPANAAAKNYATVAADALAFVPVDSDLVMGADVQQLRGSALWRKYEPKLMAKIGGGLARFKAACGYDPLVALQHVTVGMKNLGDNQKPDGVIVIHGIDRDQTLACAAKAPAGANVVNDHGVITAKDAKDGTSVVFTFVDAKTSVMLIGPAASRDRLTAVLDAGAPLRGSPTFGQMYGQLDPKASAWLLMNGNTKAFDKAAGMGFKFKAVYGTVTITEGLASTLRLRMAAADQAKQIETLAQGQLGAVKMFFDKLDVKAAGDVVVVDVVMTAAQIEMIAGQLAGMMSDDGDGKGGGGADGDSDGDDKD